jgi:hypothetical protein
MTRYIVSEGKLRSTIEINLVKLMSNSLTRLIFLSTFTKTDPLFQGVTMNLPTMPAS